MPLRIAIDAFRANPLRTTLATLGVIIGVASLVAVLALGDGFETTMRRMIAADGRLQRVIASPRTSDVVAGERVARTQVTRLGDVDVHAVRRTLRAEIRGPVEANLRLVGVARTGDAPWAVRAKLPAIPVIGTSAPADNASVVFMRHGRFLSQTDVDAGAPVAVVSDSLARMVAGRAAAAVGTTIELGGRPVTVVGVVHADAPEAKQRAVFAAMPLAIAEESFVPVPAPRAPLLELKAAHMEDVIPAKLALERWLAGRVGAAWRDSITVQSYEREAEQGAKGILLFKVFMGFITGISLVVGGIGIMNVLLASVTERTREIGIRRAVGARRRDILVQFLAESVLVSMVGGAVGTIVGMVAAVVGTTVMQRMTTTEVNPGFSGSTLLIVVTAATLVGVVFGTYPALLASRLTPIDALRHD